MLNPVRPKCWRIVFLLCVSALAAVPAEARPIIVKETRYLGPVPYQGPVITHMPISVTGSSRRYYGTVSAPRSYSSTIRRSTLVNPTVVNSQISDSVLINPVIVNSPVKRRYYGSRSGYLRYVSPGGGVQIQIVH